MESTTLLVLSCGIMCLAAIVQRITGLGFALAATPPMVLLVGADEGVKTVVAAGALVSGGMVLGVWRDIDWRRTGWVVLGGAVVAPLGAWVAASVQPRTLLVIVGVAGLLSLAGGPLLRRAAIFSGTPGAVASGGLSGFLHVTSGLSGPPLVAYGLQSRWGQRSFVASLQIVLLAFHAATLGLRGLPDLTAGTALPLAAAALVGLGAGTIAVRQVPAVWARRGTLAIAWVGTAAVLLRGVFG